MAEKMDDWVEKIYADLLAHSPREKRNYLGMSGIGGCPREQWTRFKHGETFKPALLRYGYTGYLHERDAKIRLARVGLYVPHSEIELVAPFDSRFRGHTDGATAEGDLLELKSVGPVRFAAVRQGDILREHQCQVQTYMYYGPWKIAYVVYINRDTFAHLVFSVPKDDALGLAMERRAEMILRLIDDNTPPVCTCGWCENA